MPRIPAKEWAELLANAPSGPQVLECKLDAGDGVPTVTTERCGICGRKHHHGAADLPNVGAEAHRVPHCVRPPTLPESRAKEWESIIRAGYVLRRIA